MNIKSLLLSSVLGLTSVFGGVASAGESYPTNINLCQAESTNWNKTWSYGCVVTVTENYQSVTFEVYTNEKSDRFEDPAVPVRRVILTGNDTGLLVTDTDSTFVKWAHVKEYDKNWIVVTDDYGNRFYMISNFNR